MTAKPGALRARRRRWPWWARRELGPYFASVIILAALIVLLGYLGMAELANWRLARFHP